MLIGLLIRPMELNNYLAVAVNSMMASDNDVDTPVYQFGTIHEIDDNLLEDINAELAVYISDYRHDITTEHYSDELQTIFNLVHNTALTESDRVFNVLYPNNTPEIVSAVILNPRGDVLVKWSVRTMLTLQHDTGQ